MSADPIPFPQTDPDFPPPLEEEHHEDLNGHAYAPTTKAVLWASSAPWSESEIPRRPWVVHRYLLRGSVTLLSGAGSAGKSTVVKAWTVSAITGSPFGQFQPPGPLRILSYNVEDDRHEEYRRLSATLRQFNRTPQDLAGNLMLVGPEDIGTLIERDTFSGKIRFTEAFAELSDLIAAFKPDVVFLDPLVELHTSDENDNTSLRAVVAQLRALARRHNVAICVLHHTRKGATAPGDPESSRGAGAIVGAARIVFTVCPMSDEEALDLGVPAANHKLFFRLDGAKMNYTQTGDPEWFQRISYDLDNGESVAAAVPWNPPRHTATSDELAAILKAIASAPSPISPRLSADKRSFATLCLRFGITGREDQRRALAAIKATYGVTEALFTRPGKTKGDTATGLRTAEGEPSSAFWET